MTAPAYIVVKEPGARDIVIAQGGSLDLTVRQGETFARTIMWEVAPIVYKAITGITKAAPPVLTVASHGMVDQWRCAVLSAGGMRQINAKHTPPIATELRTGTVASASSISLNEVDSTNYTTYTSGGYLAYRTPASMASGTARLQARQAIADTATLISLTSVLGTAVDDTLKTITLSMSATVTAALSFTSPGVYDLEFVSSGGTVTRLMHGNISLVKEVTR